MLCYVLLRNSDSKYIAHTERDSGSGPDLTHFTHLPPPRGNAYLIDPAKQHSPKGIENLTRRNPYSVGYGVQNDPIQDE